MTNLYLIIIIWLIKLYIVWVLHFSHFNIIVITNRPVSMSSPFRVLIRNGIKIIPWGFFYFKILNLNGQQIFKVIVGISNSPLIYTIRRGTVLQICIIFSMAFSMVSWWVFYWLIFIKLVLIGEDLIIQMLTTASVESLWGREGDLW